MSVCAPEVSRWKTKGAMERKMRREEALGAEYLESHTCVPHTPTHAHICWNRDELLVQSCRLRAFFFFFFSLAKWSLCPHENLWHFIPAEKWAGRRFDHKSASSHSSQSAAALRGTDLVLFSLPWENVGAIGIDLDLACWPCVLLCLCGWLRGSPVLSMGQRPAGFLISRIYLWPDWNNKASLGSANRKWNATNSEAMFFSWLSVVMNKSIIL